MPLLPGTNNNASGLYVGSNAVSKIYRGSQEVWSALATGEKSSVATVGAASFTFDQAYVIGRYVDGPVVVRPGADGAVRITKQTPAQTTRSAQNVGFNYNRNVGGYTRFEDVTSRVHGAQLNPQVGQNNALDERANIAKAGGSFDPSLGLALPATLSEGDVVAKVVSTDGMPNGDNDTDFFRRGIFAEDTALIVKDEIPTANTFAPATRSWDGRTEWRSYDVDIDAVVDSLPNTYDVSDFAELPPFNEIVEVFDQFYGMYPQAFGGTWGNGYETFSPSLRDGPPAYNYGYGRDRGRIVGAMTLALLLPETIVSRQLKRRIVTRVISLAIQIGDPWLLSTDAQVEKMGANGGHHVWQLALVSIGLKFMGRESELGLLKPRFPTNIIGQIFIVGQWEYDGINNPHDDPELPDVSRRAPVEAVNGDFVRLSDMSGHKIELPLYREGDESSTGAIIRRFSDSNAGEPDNMFYVPDHNLSVGDTTWCGPAYDVSIGDVEYAVQRSQRAHPDGFHSYVGKEWAPYRTLQKTMDDLMAMRALGAWHPDFEPALAYALRCIEPNEPSVEHDFPSPFDIAHTGEFDRMFYERFGDAIFSNTSTLF